MMQLVGVDRNPGTMLPRYRFTAVWLCSVLAFACSREPATSEEVYAVLSAAIQELSAETPPEYRLIIRGRAPVEGDAIHRPGREEGFPDWVAAGIPTLSKAAWRDFIEQNRRTVVLADSFSIDREVVLLEPGWENDLEMNGRAAWQARFPGPQIIMSLSRPGFDRTGGQALVHISLATCDPPGCHSKGWYVLLGRERVGWIVQEKMLSWIE